MNCWLSTVCGIARFNPNITHVQSLLIDWSFVYIYKRPILGDNPKPHKILLKSSFSLKSTAFQHFSLKSTALFMELCFSLKSTALFMEWHFSLKSTVLFMKVHFSLKGAVLFTEKQQKHLIQHRSLIMTWCFIEYRGKAN